MTAAAGLGEGTNTTIPLTRALAEPAAASGTATTPTAWSPFRHRLFAAMRAAQHLGSGSYGLLLGNVRIGADLAPGANDNDTHRRSKGP